jgi:adenylate cyclase
MTTSSEHAKSATAALHQVLHGSPGDFDVEGAAADQAITNATRERDIRASQQLMEAQAAAQERLARLLSASPAVIYSFKATADFAPTFISDNITSVFGYTPAEYLTDPSFWRDRVHPSDLASVEQAISAFFHNGIHVVEYRFRHKDGSYRWVNDLQHLIRGVDGKPFEIVGSWSDITARKAAEEERAAAHVRLNQLLMSSPAVIYSYRATGDFAPTFVSQNRRTGSVTSPASTWRAPISGGVACTRTRSLRWKLSRASCLRKAGTRSSSCFCLSVERRSK